MNVKLLPAVLLIANSCMAQTTNKMEQNSNPLLCDTASGVCEIHGTHSGGASHIVTAKEKPVKIIYFTDPICSSCWGIEPQLRRLKLEYGNEVEIEYHMGGLLPDWSYNSGGISKPADVAHHWDEVSVYYKMPIDGDIWLEDPLHSSYPPSIAFKAAQLQDDKKAIVFMRHLREMVFLQKKNITKWEHIAQAATLSGLDPQQLKTDYEGKAKELFDADLELARKMGVRGFPTIFVTGKDARTEMVYGSKPYAAYENAIRNIYKQAIKSSYNKNWKHIFEMYPTLTSREFAELSDVTIAQAETTLAALVKTDELTTLTTKNGVLWIKK